MDGRRCPLFTAHSYPRAEMNVCLVKFFLLPYMDCSFFFLYSVLALRLSASNASSFLILYLLKYCQITLLIFSCLVFSSFIFARSKNVPLLDSSPKCTTQIMQVVRSKLRSEQSSVHAVSEVQVISITAESAVYRI